MKWFRHTSPEVERRRAPRYPIYTAVRVLLPDSMTSIRAHMLDISDFGTVLESYEVLPYGARINLDVRDFHLWGTGYIRRCSAKGHRYVCGVELQGPLVSYPPSDGWGSRARAPKKAEKGLVEGIPLDGNNPE